MELFNWANEKVKKLSAIDVKLIALIGICLGLILVKLIPSVLSLSAWWFVIIGGLFSLRVYYVIFFKK